MTRLMPVLAALAICPSLAAADWSDRYVAGSVGAGEVRGEALSDLSMGTLRTLGVAAGLQSDRGDWVAGLEAEIAGQEIEGAAEHGTSVRLKGKIGADLGRTMPYLTAGIAAIRTGGAGTGAGAVAGIGVEYRATDRITLGAEYLAQSYEMDGGESLRADSLRFRMSLRF